MYMNIFRSKHRSNEIGKPQVEIDLPVQAGHWCRFSSDLIFSMENLLFYKWTTKVQPSMCIH